MLAFTTLRRDPWRELAAMSISESGELEGQTLEVTHK